MTLISEPVSKEHREHLRMLASQILKFFEQDHTDPNTMRHVLFIMLLGLYRNAVLKQGAPMPEAGKLFWMELSQYSKMIFEDDKKMTLEFLRAVLNEAVIFARAVADSGTEALK